jgi:hypothetical protein
MADYFVAERCGWLLYLEGSTDLAILARLAERLNHPAKSVLQELVPVNYLGTNKPNDAREHFEGLREAKADLVGIVLFDRLDKELRTGSQLVERAWKRREIENYLVTPESLRGFVTQGLRENDLIEQAESKRRLEILDQVVQELESALRITNQPSPWGADIKVTDQFLDPLFKNFYERLGTPQRIFKRDYHGLAEAIPIGEIDPEITEVLDEIYAVSQRAKPAGGNTGR